MKSSQWIIGYTKLNVNDDLSYSIIRCIIITSRVFVCGAF